MVHRLYDKTKRLANISIDFLPASLPKNISLRVRDSSLLKQRRKTDFDKESGYVAYCKIVESFFGILLKGEILSKRIA